MFMITGGFLSGVIIQSLVPHLNFRVNQDIIIQLDYQIMDYSLDVFTCSFVRQTS